MKQNKQKSALVLGVGGFIGGHLAMRLHRQGYKVRGVDLKYNRYFDMSAIDFIIGDLRDPGVVCTVIDHEFDEVYLLASQMGGAGYIFTGNNDAEIMYDSTLIALNVINECHVKRVKKLFFSSSACIYPESIQLNEGMNKLRETDAYPAMPDSEYGWGKIYLERVIQAYAKNHLMDVRIARFHNIMGERGSFFDGKEKAPAALCRKVIMAKDGDEIEIWGSGNQVRTFLHIDDCLDAVELLMKSDHKDPINIGSEEAVSINELAKMIIGISGKKINIKNKLDAPTGVAGRSSDNELIEDLLNWKPKIKIYQGVIRLYGWMKNYIESEAEIIYERNPDTGQVRTYIIDNVYPGKNQRFLL